MYCVVKSRLMGSAQHVYHDIYGGYSDYMIARDEQMKNEKNPFLFNIDAASIKFKDLSGQKNYDQWEYVSVVRVSRYFPFPEISTILFRKF